jgi:hypothetical protein
MQSYNTTFRLVFALISNSRLLKFMEHYWTFNDQRALQENAREGKPSKPLPTKGVRDEVLLHHA